MPDVAVMVATLVPIAAVLVASKVSVVIPARPGVNVAVTPAGRLLAENETVPAKPFWPATVSVVVP